MKFQPARSAAVDILGYGLVSAAGTGRATTLRTLSTTPPRTESVEVPAILRPVPFFRASHDPTPAGERLYRQAASAAAEALDMAQLTTEQRARTPLLLGSSSLELPASEAHYAAGLARGEQPLPLERSGFALLAHDLGQRIGIGGGETIFNTACTSSANALLYARRLILTGRADQVLVVGCEGYNSLSLAGFESLMLIAGERLRPFDENRDGTILGEGAGAMVLGRAPEEGGVEHFRLRGGAQACDTSSPTTSSPEAIRQVMMAALKEANCQVGEVDLIKAHATATPSNDAAEAEALSELFRGKSPALTALKGWFGHTLGACGAIEIAALLSCLEDGLLPASAGLADPIPGLPAMPAQEAGDFQGGTVMANFFGFGGNNTSLLLECPSGVASAHEGGAPS